MHGKRIQDLFYPSLIDDVQATDVNDFISSKLIRRKMKNLHVSLDRSNNT